MNENLSGYRVRRTLASGGFSEVFLVTDPDSILDEDLVLKRLHPDMSRRPRVVRAFEQEARLLRELNHPNVVSFRRCFFDGEGRVCLLMEKVEGTELGPWLEHHRDDPAEVLRVFQRILDAVDYLHHRPRPLLHLDLKPENILVQESPGGPVPTLIDFGIARGEGEEGLKAHTPPYSAPEQRQGGALGCPTDVHALGQLLAELLEVLGDSLDPERSRALRGVAEKAVQPSPRRRYADAAEMRRAFRAARATGTGEQGTATFEGTLARTLESLPGALRRPAVAGTLALLLILAGGLAAVLLVPSTEGPPEGSARAELVENFHHELESALHSESPLRKDRHVRTARDLLAASTLDEVTRQRLKMALDDVVRTMETPLLLPAERDEALRRLSHYIDSTHGSSLEDPQ